MRNEQLQQQVLKYFGDKPIPPELEVLFQTISRSFDNYEKEHKFLNKIMNLSSEELFNTNTELRKRNEELDRFVYSTSHDLRAPLTSILGLLQLIDLKKDKKDIGKYLNQIKKTILQLDDFIQDIVNYTHNKKADIELTEIDFDSLINNCIDKLSFMSHAASIEKKLEIRSACSFYCDVQRMDNLFSNLISNSIKYSNTNIQNPFVKIGIDVTPEKALITVEDNGIGIGDVHIDRIFEMFYRASAKSKGSGIGLYIVKEIIEKLQGTISVTSKINEGTIFTLMIPNQKS